MGIICDTHMHSSFSGDSKTSLRDMAVRANDLGLKMICFTEHMDFNFPYLKGEEGMFTLNTDSYLYELLKVRSEYEGKMDIGYGVELGLKEDAVRQNAIYIKNHEFDYVIASLHLVNEMDPYYPEYFADKTDEEGYITYFKSIYDDINKFQNFDCLGHIDYIVRYGKSKDTDYSYPKYAEYIDPILKFLVEHEKGLEINTAGIRKGLKNVHPLPDILKRYRELGGELVTIGSDAHDTSAIASDYDKALEALEYAGFKYYCMYMNRIAEFKKIV